jgi:hypothetical protein
MQFELDVHIVHYYINSEHHPTLFTEQSQTKENNVLTYRNLSTNGTHNENQCEPWQPSLYYAYVIWNLKSLKMRLHTQSLKINPQT